jgi:CHAD domain-containing protein
VSRPEPPAGEVLAAVVKDLVARLEERLPAALADDPDGVHQLRTAVRRLRNVLAAFAAYFEPGSVGMLRAGLGEYGDQLGRVRDLEVRAEWCREVAAEVGLDAALVDTLVVPLDQARARAHADLVAWAASPEAERLRRSLCTWADAPSLVEGRSARPARVVAREVLMAQVERVLAHGEDHRADEDSAHDLRKSGRRLRHTADAVTKPPAGVLGKDAVALGELGARIQSLLGDHRDALLLADHLRRSFPDTAERSAYTPMVEAAAQAAATAIDAVPAVLADLRALSEERAKVGGWTSGSAS